MKFRPESPNRKFLHLAYFACFETWAEGWVGATTILGHLLKGVVLAC